MTAPRRLLHLVAGDVTAPARAAMALDVAAGAEVTCVLLGDAVMKADVAVPSGVTVRYGAVDRRRRGLPPHAKDVDDAAVVGLLAGADRACSWTSG